MYVCICNAVTERHIQIAVRQGARRMRDLRAQLGITKECNNCANCAHKCLKSALHAHSDENRNAEASQIFPGELSLEMEIS